MLEIDGYELAHRQAEPLIKAGVSAAGWRLNGPAWDGKTPRHRPLFEHYVAEQALMFGRVDLEQLREQYRGNIVGRVRTELATHSGAVDRDELTTRLRREYDADVTARVLAFLQQSAQLAGRGNQIVDR